MRLFPIFTGLFVAVLMISQVTATKPVQWGPLAFTGADLIFPLSYLLGDMLTEVYGFARSRVVIWTGLGANLLMALALFAVGSMPGAPDWVADGGQQAWDMLLGLTPRIAAASLLAYFVGEFVNAYVLARLKVRTRGRFLWLRTIGSTLVGQGVDTVIFFPVAYWGAWPASLILHIMLVAYLVKVMVEVLLTPFTYALVYAVKRVTGMDVYDTRTDFNPFRIVLHDEDPGEAPQRAR
ncbi:MAG: queuosine precursor transporter [Limnochordales bacterium]|nr:queuosine precursor transporter [Limnochordales bacterium]